MSEEINLGYQVATKDLPAGRPIHIDKYYTQKLLPILENMKITLNGMGSSDDVETLRLDIDKALEMMK